MSTRLEKVYRKAQRVSIDKNSRIVCMSDCHRGVGNRGDNFLPNENLFYAALQYYYSRHFWYIELGDGDELWENRDLGQIVEIHSEVFGLLSQFYQSGRFSMLYGNHDCQKKRQKNGNAYCHKSGYSSMESLDEPFQGLCVQEGLILEMCPMGQELFLVHGHQGDLLNDTLWPLARFLVRYVWKPLELIGVSDPTSAARNYKKCKKTEKRLEEFSEKKQIMVMAGHTHRPVLSKPGEGRYFNDGSCVHPQCITAIEIENGAVTLVKWSVDVDCNRRLSVQRRVLGGPYAWEQYFIQRNNP